MQIQSLCNLPSALLPFRPREDQFSYAVICKATYRLTPVMSALAPEQEPLCFGEKYYNDDPTQSVERPNDMVPVKSRAEVLVVGSAYSPQRRPVRMLQVRVIANEVDKAIDVYCQRTMNRDGSIREGMSWMAMPLRYERAAGGVDTWNPQGLASHIEPAHASRNLPQLVPAGFFSTDPAEQIPVAGFGPISAHWPIRRDKLGLRANTFSENHLHQQLLGKDFDALFFQAAPRDQQLPEKESWRPDERIVLENLHPDHPRLVTKLPGMVPKAFLNYHGHAGTPLALRADTLWIDTDRGLCTLVFRGQLPVGSFDQPGSIVLVLQGPGETISWADVQNKLGPADKPAPAYDPDTTTELNVSAFRALRPATPFMAPKRGANVAPTESPSRPTSTDDEPRTAVYDVNALRLGQEQRQAASADVPAAKAETTRAVHTAALVGSKPVLPFGQTPAPTAPALPIVPPMAPPPLPPPTASYPGANPTFSTPALHTGFAAPPTTSDLSRQTPPAYVDAPPPPPRVVEVLKPVALGEPQAKNMAAATYEGVVAASNAAAEPQPLRSGDKSLHDKPSDNKPSKATGESIEVIWYDSAYVARMRKHSDWAPLFRPPPKPQAPQRGQPPPPPPSAEQLEDATKADVFAVLSRAEPSREHDVAPGRMGSGDHDAQLYLLAGTISFPLDEIEMLKATARTAAPLAANDKKLKEVLDTVEEILKMPLEGAPEVVQGFTNKVRDAWSHANRLLPPDYLVTHTERMLLNQRQYQKRELLDDEWIRCLYLGSAESVAIPTYIPAKLAKRLPLFRQFSVRMIIEALSQQDMYESHPMALRVVGLAKVLGAEPAPSKAKR